MVSELRTLRQHGPPPPAAAAAAADDDDDDDDDVSVSKFFALALTALVRF